jgi:hypothetical protein
MYTEIVSYIIAWWHVYRDCVKCYSLMSCLQRLCQILYLGVMLTEIVSNIIAWCHVYRDCVKYYSLVSCLQKYVRDYILV